MGHVGILIAFWMCNWGCFGGLFLKSGGRDMVVSFCRLILTIGKPASLNHRERDRPRWAIPILQLFQVDKTDIHCFPKFSLSSGLPLPIGSTDFSNGGKGHLRGPFKVLILLGTRLEEMKRILLAVSLHRSSPKGDSNVSVLLGREGQS